MCTTMTRFGKILIILVVILLVGIGYLFYQLISSADPIDPYLSHITTQNGIFVYNESSQYYDISFSYPVTLPSVVLSDIENYLRDEVSTFKSEGSFENLSAENVTELGFDGERKYTLTFEYAYYGGEKISTHILRGDVWTGGAHSNQTIKIFSYDLALKKVSIENIITDETKLAVTSSLIREQIIKQFSVEGEELALFSEGLNPIYDNFRNFYFTDSGIHFIYPPYYVLPYSYGSVDTIIPFEEIYQYITPEFIPESFVPLENNSGSEKEN